MRKFHHSNYKNYRNLPSTLFKRHKETISQTYLMKTRKDIKRTWKGVESLVSITPSLITKDEKYINDPVSIANTFNNLFTSGAETVHSKTKFSNKLFRNFLPS